MLKSLTPLLLLLLIGSPAMQQEKILEESWFLTRNNGEKVGYFRWTLRSLREDGKDIVRGETTGWSMAKDKGEDVLIFQRQVDDESPDGKALGFRERDIVGAKAGLESGSVVGAKLEITRVEDGKKTTRSIDWPADGVSAAGPDRLLRAAKGAPGATFTYHLYHTGLHQIIEYAAKVIGREKVSLGGQEQDLLKVETTLKIGPGHVTNMWYDEKLVNAKLLDVYGDIETTNERSDPAAALFLDSGDLPPILARMILKTKSRAPDPRKVARATIHVTVKMGSLPPCAFDGQTPDKPGRSVTFKVAPQRADAGIKRPVTDAKLKTWLDAAAYVETKDPAIAKAAADIVGSQADAWKAAKKIEAWVREKMKRKDFGAGWLGAKEALAKLEGDSSECAVLLTALARAAGIPARIAVGVVLVDDAFVPHLWVEAWAGKWAPLDAYFAADPVDAARLKLFESAGGKDLVGCLESVVSAIGDLEIEGEWDPKK